MGGIAVVQWLLTSISMALVVGGVVVVVVIVRNLGSGRSHEPVQSPGLISAREILDQRYARGEIDTVEYQERLRQLGDR